MIHGALHFRVGDGHIFRTLSRRTVRHRSHINPRLLSWDRIPGVGSTTGRIPVWQTLFLMCGEHKSHSWMRLLKNIFVNPYLLDEGSAVSLFAFLFEGLPGMGAALFGDTPGVAWRAERLPF